LRKWREKDVASIGARLLSGLPAPIKTLLRSLGLRDRLLGLLHKETVELAFQERWAREFSEGKEKAREYWRTFRFLDEITALCRLGPEKAVLDVGCGISTVLHFVPGKRHGIDPLAEEYRRLYRYPDGIEVERAPGEEIPFPDGRFDVVFCSNVLDHVADPGKTLAEIDRVLKHEGFLALTVEVFDESRERDPAHPHSFTLDDLTGLLSGRFATLMARTSRCTGLRAYVVGIAKEPHTEAVIVARKKGP